jgi:MFS family permease
MDAKQITRSKLRRIRLTRVILSLCLPSILGTIIYSFFSGFYQESIFWISFIMSIPGIFLLMLIPSSIYTVLMEYLGRKLIQKSLKRKKFSLRIFIFLFIGTGLGNLYILLSDPGSSLIWHIVVTLMGLTVTFVKIRLHFRERRYRQAAVFLQPTVRGTVV